MSDPILYIDTSDIREGKLDELEAAMERLAAFIEENNPHVLSYRFFLDRDASRMTVFAAHPDSAALEFHMDVGKDEFRKFREFVELSSIAVYGDVSESVLERLHAKAEMLGGATVAVHDPHAGFAR